jgi:hypothetical protein
MAEPLADGALIEKINSDPGDGHQDGAQGTIVSHLGPMPAEGLGQGVPEYGYFVSWADMPGLPVFVGGNRVQTMIVKLQVPLSTNDTPKALLYNQSRSFEMLYPITEQMRERLNGRPQAFFKLDLTQGEPILLDEVPDPGW